MVGITRRTLKEDYELLSELRDRYQNAIWEGQEGQPAHFDNQHKIVKMAMCDVRTGLNLAVMALHMLNDMGVIED